jgi:hypothetical protein
MWSLPIPTRPSGAPEKPIVFHARLLGDFVDTLSRSGGCRLMQKPTREGVDPDLRGRSPHCEAKGQP